MIKRGYRTQESQIRYWVGQAVDLCHSIDDKTLTEAIPAVKEAVAALKRDRRVLVFGAKGCGKSALLAGISGCSVIAKSEPDMPYTRWRFQCPDGDAEHSRFLPEDSLAGLELVDTRSCTDEAVAKAVRALMPDADVLIAAVDTRSVKDSPVWGLLADLPQESLGTCLLAATFTDKLSAETSLNIAKNLQEFSKERLGVALRVCVSNPTSGQSMASLAAKVQEILDGGHGVRKSIRHMAERGTDIVRKQGHVLNERAAVTRTGAGFLSNIEQEIDNFHIRQQRGTQGLIDSYSSMALKVIPDLQHKLRRVMGYTLSPVTLIRLERLAASTEECLYNMLCTEILDMQFEADRQFVLSCSEHWANARPRMLKTLACEIGDFPGEELGRQLAALRSGLCRDLHDPFLKLQLRSKLSHAFTAPTGWLLLFFWTTCLALIMAGVLGFAGMDDIALLCVGVAAVIWLLGSAMQYFATRSIIKQVSTQTGVLSQGLRQALEETAPKFVTSRVSAYRFLYVKPRQTVAQHETMLAPLQERYKFINMQLNATAQRL